MIVVLWHQLSTQENTILFVAQFVCCLDIAETPMVTRFEEDGENLSGQVSNPNEKTSQSIMIRDPETGAIIVQTQLLQVSAPK